MDIKKIGIKKIALNSEEWRDHQVYVLFCTIICIIFTSLCKNLVKLTWVLAVKWSENDTYYSAK